MVIGYTESRLDGRAAQASLGPDGINHGLSGSPPTNEAGTMETCSYLIAAMNKAGSTWGQPVLAAAHDDADAICGQLHGGSEVLRIQVVRAQSNAAFWKEVHLNQCATMSGSAVGLADELSFQRWGSLNGKRFMPSRLRIIPTKTFLDEEVE